MKKIFSIFAITLLMGGFFTARLAVPRVMAATDVTPEIVAAPPGGIEKLDFVDCVKNPVTCAMYGITYAGTYILGGLMIIAAWLTKYALYLNSHILSLPAVVAGFEVSLAMANLGFVLGIIVIAIATILRMQSYGMKALLFKLIVMAVLINFSMVFASGILGASDKLTNYFLANTVPSSLDQYEGFVTVMTRSFSPQRLFQSTGFDSAEAAITISTSLGQFMKQILNMVFIIIFLFLAVVAFVVLAVMFLIRYVYIGFLLILMPLAWMAWVFPNLKKHWTDWWNKFLQWTFFAPLMLFFLYLAFLTVQGTGTGGHSDYLQQAIGEVNATSSLSGITASVKQVADAQAGDLLSTAAQMIMVLALMYGGFFAASKMGITGAGAAMGIAQGAGKAAAGWANTKTRGAVARYLTTPRSEPQGPNMPIPGLRGSALRTLGRVRKILTPFQGALAPEGALSSEQQRDKLRREFEAPMRVKAATDILHNAEHGLESKEKALEIAKENLADARSTNASPENIKAARETIETRKKEVEAAKKIIEKAKTDLKKEKESESKDESVKQLANARFAALTDLEKKRAMQAVAQKQRLEARDKSPEEQEAAARQLQNADRLAAEAADELAKAERRVAQALSGSIPWFDRGMKGPIAINGEGKIGFDKEALKNMGVVAATALNNAVNPVQWVRNARENFDEGVISDEVKKKLVVYAAEAQKKPGIIKSVFDGTLKGSGLFEHDGKHLHLNAAQKKLLGELGLGEAHGEAHGDGHGEAHGDGHGKEDHGGHGEDKKEGGGEAHAH